ncbi:tetratricopeptide repeat protein 25 isoform X2 [Eurytemora carolleeae]|uniref:tetratricopeptide repeat protein 25 isoform X2 n=1 Tax=Eurytemora carolleeae TaxID=1294199 RepID=UPI000C788D5F|nr:tetratricopeptide repeat protein 25 isoform X2 [Eurytemora carolleeae]|eukprot:XP_023321609.1 tetratricopeptide repeat protein 25-like isoform X2 [Eurytemora affinis]
MKASGLKVVEDRLPGASDENVLLRQAKHFLKIGRNEAALIHLNSAVCMDPGNLEVLATRSKCNLKLGRWEEALLDAEEVLLQNPQYVKAMYGKGESLFNMCHFEHALLCFHKGQALAPDNEEFQLGVIKARKTISNSLPANIFKFDGLQGFLTKNKLRSVNNPEGCLLPSQQQKSRLKSKTTKNPLKEDKEDYEFLECLHITMMDGEHTSSPLTFTENNKTAKFGVCQVAEDGMMFLSSRQQFWGSIK